MLIEKGSSGRQHNWSIDEMRQRVLEQNRDRVVWQEHDNPQFFRDYIKEEYVELANELHPDNKEQTRWGIASEIGDIEYLCVRYQAHIAPEELPNEVQFFRSVAWELAKQLNLNVADCVHLKIIRNDLKYPMGITNMHEYEEGRELSKKLWSLMGGDKAFYKWYEEVFGAI